MLNNKIDIKTSEFSSESERQKFEAMADEWWDPAGKFKPLHQINPVRLNFILEQAKKNFNINTKDVSALKNLSILDIGCGGGLVAEPLSRLGAKMMGIDVVEKNIKIASAHRDKKQLDIDYHCADIVDLEGKEFDIVLCLEVVEHVENLPLFLKKLTALVKKDGLLILSTINRTLKSYALAIIGAEYIMRWLPKGTHDWNAFVKPSELVLDVEKNGLKTQEISGYSYSPFTDSWSMTKNTDVNYIMSCRK